MPSASAMYLAPTQHGHPVVITVKHPLAGLRWTLSTKWIGPFESAFGILHKFAWQNFIDGKSFVTRQVFDANKGEVFFGLDSPGCCSSENESQPTKVIPPYVTNANFIDDHWFAAFADFYKFRLNLEEHLFSKKVGVLTWALMQRNTIRFCPRCLAHGYHTYFFQLGSIKRCPIHDVELISNCRMCGSPAFGSSLRQGFSPLFSGLLHCQRCHQPPAGHLHIHKFFDNVDFHQTARTAFTPLHDWLVDLCHFRTREANRTYAVVDFQRFAENFGQVFDNEHLVALELAEQFRAFPLNRSLLFEQSASKVIELKRNMPARGCDKTDATLTSRVAMYKSIKRQLIKKIGGNRHEMFDMHGQFVLDTHRVQGNVHALLDVGMCPLAAAIALWRMTYESHLLPPTSQRVRLKNLSELSAKEKFCSSALLPSKALSDREWAHSVMSAFHARCMVFADFIKEVINKPDDERRSRVWAQPAYMPNLFLSAVLNLQTPARDLGSVEIDGPSNCTIQEGGSLVFSQSQFANLYRISRFGKPRCCHRDKRIKLKF
jgi:hypothetical protein